MLRNPLRSFAPALAALVVAATLGPASASAATCTKVASPAGSDTASGTESTPYRTLQKLASSLTSGGVGCLRAGTYTGADVRLSTPDVTLTSYPGERATIGAFVEVYPEAVRARIENLRIDGSLHTNGTGIKLQADDTAFIGNEVTMGGRGICLVAGSWNPAQRVVIERNKIYNCGPAGTKYDHQIYLPHSRGAIVRWNLLYGNGGGWGVHLYPDADGTVVEHNVIDGNTGGVVFAGDGSGATSDGNVVRNNAITYSAPRWNAEGSWSGGPVGSGNSVYGNCVYSSGPDSPSGIAGANGFSAFSNTVLGGSPYVDRASRDYRFQPASPCASLVGDVAGTVAGGAAPAPAADTTAPNTSVDSGPSATTTSTTASFTFSATEAGATFECRLDGGSWAACASPKAYSGLAAGDHVFEARAKDGAGNTDATPDDWRWTVSAPAPAPASVEDKALGRPATASSSARTSRSPAKANDGDTGTRWSAARLDGQWWQVDLGRERQVNRVVLNWHSSYATRYRILTSGDGTNFTQAAEVTLSAAGLKETTFTARSTRYVRILALSRAGREGPSIYDARVFGAAD